VGESNEQRVGFRTGCSNGPGNKHSNAGREPLMSVYGACGRFSRVTSTGSMLDLALQKFDFYRQFNRWRQENFFKYMQEEFGLDGLLEYGTDPVSLNPA
jgi:hypothetical protein